MTMAACHVQDDPLAVAWLTNSIVQSSVLTVQQGGGQLVGGVDRTSVAASVGNVTSDGVIPYAWPVSLPQCQCLHRASSHGGSQQSTFPESVTIDKSASC